MVNRQSTTFTLRAALLGSALSVFGFAAQAQVTVDLSAIDAVAPASPSGRIVLRPPLGTAPISNPSDAIRLRLPAKKAPAPVAPKPAVVAEAPAPAAQPMPAAQPAPAPAPTMTPPPPAPAPVAAAPKPAPAPAPAAAKPAAQPAPAAAAPMTPPPAATPVPSAAAARSAQQEPVGPVANVLPDTQQTAALPPATKAEIPDPGEDAATAMTIAFAAGVADLDVGGQGSVKDLAQRLSADKSIRVQLMAYATDPEKNTSKARRLALDRAIAIRNMLIDAGVERTRIEVRALGDQGEGGNLDRVDAVAIKR